MNMQNPIIHQIIQLADQSDPGSEVYLFGSRAKGTENDLSDWDLLILLNTDKIPFETEKHILDEFYSLELKTGEIFSPLHYTKSEWENKYKRSGLFQVIHQEGIRLK